MSIINNTEEAARAEKAKAVLSIDAIKKKYSILKSVFQSRKLFNDDQLFAQLIYLVFFNIYEKELFITKSKKIVDNKIILMPVNVPITPLLDNFLDNVYDDTKDKKNTNLKSIFLQNVRSLTEDFLLYQDLLSQKLNINNRDDPLFGKTRDGIYDDFSEEYYEKDPEIVILDILRTNQFDKTNVIYKFLKNNAADKRDFVIKEDNKERYLNILFRYFSDSIKKELNEFKFDYDDLGLKNITIQDIYNNPRMNESYSNFAKHKLIAFMGLGNKFETYLTKNPLIIQKINFNFLFSLLNISRYIADLDKTLPTDLSKDEINIILYLFNDIFDILLEYLKFKKIFPLKEDAENAARVAAEAARQAEATRQAEAARHIEQAEANYKTSVQKIKDLQITLDQAAIEFKKAKEAADISHRKFSNGNKSIEENIRANNKPVSVKNRKRAIEQKLSKSKAQITQVDIDRVNSIAATAGRNVQRLVNLIQQEKENAARYEENLKIAKRNAELVKERRDVHPIIGPTGAIPNNIPIGIPLAPPSVGLSSILTAIPRGPSAPIPAPSAPIPAPSAPIPAPSAPIPAPSTPIPAPSAPIPAPSAPIPAPSAIPINAPTILIVPPKDHKALTDFMKTIKKENLSKGLNFAKTRKNHFR